MKSTNEIRESLKMLIKRSLVLADLDLSRGAPERCLSRVLDAVGCDLVFDVGANYGQYARLLRQASWEGRIISFEPLSSTREILLRASAHDPLWSVRPVALGSTPGEAEMYVSQNSHSSSLLPMLDSHLVAAPTSRYVGTESVKVSTLGVELAQVEPTPLRPFLKIDTQGFESAVLDGADDLSQFCGIQLELSLIPLYEGQVLYGELVSRLEDLGFTLWHLDPGIHDSTGRMLQCDGIFVNASHIPANCASELAPTCTTR